MTKSPETCNSRAFSQYLPKNIVLQSFNNNNSQSPDHHRGTVDYPDHLGRLIQQYRLTDCLECLEQSSYYGDAAIFMLGYIQGGVA